MKLITEHCETVSVIKEETEKGLPKAYYLEGVTLQGNIKNRNGRIYEMRILENEVKRYTKEYIDKNRAYGELGHPDSPSINLDRVSHMIKSLKVEGTDFIGRMKIMDTPHGRIVKNFIDEGCQLGVSSRGLGTLVQREGANYVQNDFMLATAADIVHDPSAPNAFVNGIMEGAEWVYNASTKSWIIAEQLRNDIKKMTARDVANKQARMLEAYLKSL